MTDYAIIQQSSVDTAVRVRLGLSALLPDVGSRQNRSGLFDAGGVVSLTSGMSVSVSAFRAFIQGTSAANQGGYFCVRDAAATLTFANGGASNRTDIIVARIYDNTYDSSGQTKFAIEIVQGTGGGGVPATPANSIKLAEKVITAGMSAGSGGLGTAPVDKRPPRIVAAGGVVPVLDSTDRGTLATYAGLAVFRIDTKAVQVYNGTDWDTYKPIGKDGVPWAEAAGSVTVTFSAATQGTAVVTFPVGRFSVAPLIAQSVQGPGASSVTAIRMSSAPTASGYTCVVNTSGSFTGSIVIGWRAVQMTSSTADG